MIALNTDNSMSSFIPTDLRFVENLLGGEDIRVSPADKRVIVKNEILVMFLMRAFNIGN
jgi:hypothetical protein